MAHIAATYRFVRTQALFGALRQQRASTDAFNMLGEWEAQAPSDRSFVVLRDSDAQGDEEDYLIATLQTRRGDVEVNPGVLDALCEKYGLDRALERDV